MDFHFQTYLKSLLMINVSLKNKFSHMIKLQFSDIKNLTTKVFHKISNSSLSSLLCLFMIHNVSFDSFEDVQDYCSIYQIFKNKNSDEIQKGYKYDKVLYCDREYWTKLLQKHFHSDYTVLIENPDKELTKIQTKKEKERVQKQKNYYGIDGLNKLKNELNVAFEVNQGYYRKKIDLTGLKNINIKIQDEDKEIIVSPDKNLLKIPMIYRKNRDVTPDDANRFHLVFDINDLPSEYYPLLKIYLKLMPRKLKLHEDNFMIKNNQVIYDLDEGDDLNMSFIVEYFKVIFKEDKSEMKDILITLMNDENVNQPDDDNDIQSSDEKEFISIIDFFMLNNQKSINYFTSFNFIFKKYYQDLFNRVENDDDYFKKLIENLNGLHSFIEKTHLNFNIYLYDMCMVEMFQHNLPIEFDQLDKLPDIYCDKVITIDNSKVEDPSCNIDNKFCILTPEYFNITYKRYLPINIDSESDKHYYMRLLSEYIYNTFFDYRTITGKYYDCEISLHKNICLVYSLLRTNNFNQVKELHKKLIHDMINNMDIDTSLFELAKRSLIVKMFYNQSYVYFL